MEDVKILEKSIFKTNIPQKVLENAGGMNGKYSKNISLASHLINTTLLGLNCYAYENFVLRSNNIDDLEASILTAALLLHDVNKYINEKYGWEKNKNDREVLEKYLENDDFGIKELFSMMDKDIENYKEDILFLIQRTEMNDRSQETRGVSTDFRNLIDYCRLGDSVSSVITKDGIEKGAEKLRNHYSGLDFQAVHNLRFSAIEQPVLNRSIIGVIKKVLEENQEITVLGSTSNEVLYLGKEINRQELKEKVKKELPRTISENYDFKPKIGWNSTGYGILEEVGLPVDEKKEILAEEFAQDLLNEGSAGVEGFENVPDEFKKFLPVLIKKIYVDGDDNFKSEELQERFDTIKEDVGGQKVKLHFIADLLENYPENRDRLEELKNTVSEGLNDDLEPDSNGFETVVDRFFGKKDTELAGKEDQCFVCGRTAEKKYQKGKTAFYSTQSFSRRVAPSSSWHKYKKICPVCNLEYALLKNECERNDVSPGSDVEIAYLYFDEFIGDVKLYEDSVSEALSDDDQGLDDPKVVRSLLSPQFHLQPFYIGDKNQRMARINAVMKKVKDFGMKAIMGKAFTRFETHNSVFFDEKPIRVQKTLSFDKIGSYNELERPLDFFKIVGGIGADKNMSNRYIQLERDGFVELTNFMIVNNENMILNERLRSYLEYYREEEFMQMKKVAKNGLELFGKQYNSKHKKTKIFRETIDALLTGISQGMEGPDLDTFVYGQIKTAAEREDYAGKVTNGQVEDFVDSLKEYLKENNLLTLKKLSDWENALTNSYYYAYENVLNEGDN